MSAAEKIAERYLDDVAQMAPLEVASAFALGACLITAPAGESAWVHWLSQDFRASWYFLDALLHQTTWKLAGVLTAATLGPPATRWVIRKLIRIASPTLEQTIHSAYQNALLVTEHGGRSDGDIKVATEWKARRSKRLKRAMRLSSATASISLVALFTTAVTRCGLDMLFSVVSLFLAALSTWVSFRLFITTHLADQILVDSALGLTRSTLTGWESE